MKALSLFIATLVKDNKPQILHIGSRDQVKSFLFDYCLESDFHVADVRWNDENYEVVIHGIQERFSPANDVLGDKVVIYVETFDAEVSDETLV